MAADESPQGREEMVSVPVLTNVLTLLTLLLCWHITAEVEIEAQVDTAGKMTSQDAECPLHIGSSAHV